MKEQLISFKTAKLAKEKGFNEEGVWYYNQEYPERKLKNKEIYEQIKNSDFEDGIMNSDEGEIPYFTYTAPTQSLLHKWLREEHGIYVIPQIINPPSYNCEVIYKTGNFWTMEQESYEEALETGLLEALKLIKL